MTEQEHFDDPEVAARLRDFARSVRGREACGAPSLVPPPIASDQLEKRLDKVDAEIDGGRKPMLLRWPAALAIAASLLVAVGVWWIVRPTHSGSVLAIAELRLSAAPSILRGAPETQFHSFQRVWIHFTTDEPGFAAVALLDGRQVLDLVRKNDGTINVHKVEAGQNVLGGADGYFLDDSVGTETFFIITTPQRRLASEFEELVSRAGASLNKLREEAGVSHETAVETVLTGMRSDESVSAAAVAFEHLPPK